MKRFTALEESGEIAGDWKDQEMEAMQRRRRKQREGEIEPTGS
jgi:hypothetical protein